MITLNISPIVKKVNNTTITIERKAVLIGMDATFAYYNPNNHTNQKGVIKVGYVVEHSINGEPANGKIVGGELIKDYQAIFSTQNVMIYTDGKRYELVGASQNPENVLIKSIETGEVLDVDVTTITLLYNVLLSAIQNKTEHLYDLLLADLQNHKTIDDANGLSHFTSKQA